MCSAYGVGTSPYPKLASGPVGHKHREFGVILPGSCGLDASSAECKFGSTPLPLIRAACAASGTEFRESSALHGGPVCVDTAPVEVVPARCAAAEASMSVEVRPSRQPAVFRAINCVALPGDGQLCRLTNNTKCFEIDSDGYSRAFSHAHKRSAVLLVRHT